MLAQRSEIVVSGRRLRGTLAGLRSGRLRPARFYEPRSIEAQRSDSKNRVEKRWYMKVNNRVEKNIPEPSIGFGDGIKFALFSYSSANE